MREYSFRHKIIYWYAIIFYALLVFKWINNMLLYQQKPAFVYNTFDVASWLFLQTKIPEWLIATKQFLVFDIVYYTAPLALIFSAYKKTKLVSIAAFYVLIVNWIYLQTYFLYPISSYTIFVAWLIFPIIFLTSNERTFALLFAGLRYFFLYYFLSAGLWKIRNLGLCNHEQLSAILLDQHKEMLTNSADYWLSHFYQWLIQNVTLSYCLYVTVTLMELSFVIGFFTKRFDKSLIVVYFIFLLADYFIMRIPYFETLPFLLTLFFHPVNISALKSRDFTNPVNLHG